MALSLPAACDPNLADVRTGESASAPASRPAMVLAATILASSLAFVDGSVVNVALPAIGRDLAGAAADLQWVVNAYLLPLSALLLLGGGAGDRFGRRRLLVAGIALFAAASCLCAFAPGLPALLLGRVLQGVGAAMLMPNSLAVLGTAFAGEARGRAIGNPVLDAIGTRYGKSAAQVVIRWHLELGNVVIPKSVTPERIRENLEVFDFTLDAADHEAIRALDAGERTGKDPDDLG